MESSERKVILPITCPICGSIVALIPSTGTYVCQTDHVWESTELDEALRERLADNLQNLLHRIKAREFLLERMAEYGLIEPTDTVQQQALVERMIASIKKGLT